MNNQESNHKKPTPSFEMIERYVNDQLNEDESIAFEQFMQKASQDFLDLVEGVQLQKFAENLKKSSEYSDLKQDFQSEKILMNLPADLISNAPSHTIKKKTPNVAILISLAASVIIILLFLPNIINKETKLPLLTSDQPIKDSSKYVPEVSKDCTFVSPNSNETTDEEKIKKSVTPPSIENAKQQLAFAPNESLEEQITQQMRSNKVIDNIQPENTFQVSTSQSINFNWQTSLQEELRLEILNNNNQVITSLIIPKSQKTYTLLSEKLPGEGLYYWRLMDKRVLYHIGKFKVIP